MKKIISLFLIMTLLSSVLVACGDSQDTASADGTNAESSSEGGDYAGTEITVLCHMANLVDGNEVEDEDGNITRDPDTALFQFIGQEFEDETGIKVNFATYSGLDSIKNQLQVGDNSIDIVTLDKSSLDKEFFTSFFAPVMTYEEGVEMYGKEFVDASTYLANDKLYAWTQAKSYNGGIAYNEEAIQSVGYDEIPDDFDEFNEMLAKLRDADITPISLHRVESWPLQIVEENAQFYDGKTNSLSYLLESDDPFGKDGTAIGKSIYQFTKWKSEGFYEDEMYTDFGDAMKAVANGSSATMLFGAWVVPQIQDLLKDGNIDKIKYDLSPDMGYGRGIILTPRYSYMINKGSDNFDASKLFLDYLSKESEFYEKTGSINARLDSEEIVPDMFNLINEKVTSGEGNVIVSAQRDENYYKVEEILKESNIQANYQWAGLPFDALDITSPDDWSKYDEQITRQNEDFLKYKEMLGYSYTE